MLRSIAGVVVGYLIFAVPSFLLFRVTGHDPHAPATLGFEVAAVVFGMLFALLGGYVGTAIAQRAGIVRRLVCRGNPDRDGNVVTAGWRLLMVASISNCLHGPGGFGRRLVAFTATQ